MTTWKTPLLFFVALAVSSVAERDAMATSLAELSTEQLVDASDFVVRGTVSDVWTDLDLDGRVWTHAEVDIASVLKGDPDGDSVVVSQVGGIYGPAVARVESVARFSVGEDAYFFLESMGNHITVVGLAQGKFTRRMDPTLREDIVMRFTRPSDEGYDHRFLPLPPADRRIKASDFEHQIAARVAAGWDGEPIPGTTNERLQAVSAPTQKAGGAL